MLVVGECLPDEQLVHDDEAGYIRERIAVVQVLDEETSFFVLGMSLARGQT